MAIGITFLERDKPLPRNAAYTYAKVHTCDFGEEAGEP